MAKFCTNCGNSLDDNATACSNCGMNVSSAAPTTNTVEKKATDIGKKITGVLDNITSGEAFKDITPEKKQKYLKFGIIGAAAVFALIVLIIIISLIAGNTGYKGTVKKAMKAIDKTDGEAWVELLSEYNNYILPEYLADESDADFDRDDVTEELVDNAEDYLLKNIDKYFNEKAGRGYKFSYDIKDAYELEEYEYDDIYEEYDYVTIDEDGEEEVELAAEDYWKKLMVVEIELTGKAKKEKSLDLELLLAKEKGGWKIVDYNLD